MLRMIKILQVKAGSKLLTTFIKDEKGNSLVEFALILPLLLVLTVGGVYLSISFSQKSLMNGLAFMQVRAASVRQQHGSIAEHAVRNYKKRSGQKWVDSTKSKIIVKDHEDIDDLKIDIEARAMRMHILVNAVSILTGQDPQIKPTMIGSTMTLPIEYITLPGRSDRPLTTTTVDYETQAMGGSIIDELFDKLPDTLKNWVKDSLFTRVLDPKKSNDHDTQRANEILSADYNKNMRKMNELYERWGLNPKSGSEKHLPIKVWDKDFINSLNMLEESGKHIKKIEKGAILTDIILDIGKATPIGQVINAALEPLKAGGAVVLPTVEKLGTEFATRFEQNNNNMFEKSTSPIGE